MKIFGRVIFIFVSLGFTSQAVEYYIAPDGCDENTGTYEKPFASLNAVRLAVRKALSSKSEDGVTIFFRGGHYYLDTSYELSTADSGRQGAPVIYCAYPGEQVSIAGGPLFDRLLFKPISDPKVRERIIDSSARPKIVQVDLIQAGIEINRIGRLQRFGQAFSGELVDSMAPTEIFFEGKAMTIAR